MEEKPEEKEEDKKDNNSNEEEVKENFEKLEEKKVEKSHERKNISKHKEKLTEKFRENPWVLSTLVLGILVLILLVGSFGDASGNAVSEDNAGQIIVDFASSQGVDAELVEVNTKSGLYEVILSMNERDVPVYLTKDGENLIGGLTPLSILTQTQDVPQDSPSEVPKSDKPIVELFVMSFCPYGNRGEDTMLPVYNLLKDKVDFEVHYIVSINGDKVNSLHGQSEVDQNIREVCVKRDYGLDKFWKFTTYVNENCGRDGSCWEDAAKEAGVSPSEVNSCFEKDGLKLMKVEAEASNNAGASGSPTLIINGVKSNIVYQYENSEAYKQQICKAFNNAPEDCDSELTSSGSSVSTDGSC